MKRLASSPRAIAAATVALFLATTVFAASAHEMWRDEMQAWLIARDSPTLTALLRHTRFEGQPPLWYLLLFPLARLSHDPRAMQPLHLAIAAAAVWLFAARAPFSRTVRALFAFGYFPLFEYSVVCRSYGLGMLGVVALCASYATRQTRPLRTGAALALLAMANTVSWIVSCVATALLAAEQLRRPRGQRAWAGLFVAAAAIAVALAVIWPPSEMHLSAQAAPNLPRLPDALSFVADAMAPVPRFEVPGFAAFGLLATAIGVSIFVAAFALAVASERTALVFYVATTLALIAFFATVYRGDLRHHGYFFLALIAAAWMGRARRPVDARERVTNVALAALLGVQAVGGVAAIAQERRRAFSHARDAAAWMEEHGLQNAPVVAEPDWLGTPVVGYLDGAGAWSLRTHDRASFVVWNAARVREPDDAQIASFTREVCAREGRDTVLLMNRDLQPDTASAAGLELRAAFRGATKSTEDFVVYTLPVRALR